MMNIREKIDEVRKKKGMSWTMLSEKTGLSMDAFRKWNEHSPSIKNLQKVADALGVNIKKLL